jgi:hypothetical protein
LRVSEIGSNLELHKGAPQDMLANAAAMILIL